MTRAHLSGPLAYRCGVAATHRISNRWEQGVQGWQQRIAGTAADAGNGQRSVVRGYLLQAAQHCQLSTLHGSRRSYIVLACTANSIDAGTMVANYIFNAEVASVGMQYGGSNALMAKTAIP